MGKPYKQDSRKVMATLVAFCRARSAEVGSALPSAAGTGTTSCFFDTAPRTPSTNLAHLKEQRFVVVEIRYGTAVEIVAALAFR
jgi:hypothetical protein